MAKRPYIIAIDDDEWYLEYIQEQCGKHADLDLYESANDFEFASDENPGKILRADLILVDWDLHDGKGGQNDTGGFLRRDLGYKGKLVLCSNHVNAPEIRSSEKVRDNYDVLLHKTDLSWDRLADLLVSVC